MNKYKIICLATAGMVAFGSAATAYTGYFHSYTADHFSLVNSLNTLDTGADAGDGELSQSEIDALINEVANALDDEAPVEGVDTAEDADYFYFPTIPFPNLPTIPVKAPVTCSSSKVVEFKQGGNGKMSTFKCKNTWSDGQIKITTNTFSGPADMPEEVANFVCEASCAKNGGRDLPKFEPSKKE
jgi:hypothetical protein